MAEVSTNALLPEKFQGTSADIAGKIVLVWELIKAPLIVALLRVSIYAYMFSYGTDAFHKKGFKRV